MPIKFRRFRLENNSLLLKLGLKHSTQISNLMNTEGNQLMLESYLSKHIDTVKTLTNFLKTMFAGTTLRHPKSIAKSTSLSMLLSLATGTIWAISLELPTHAFNFATGHVGGSCEALLSSSPTERFWSLGETTLPECETGDGFRLIAEGGTLQTRKYIGTNGSIVGIGVTDQDWTNLAGPCMVGIVSPCNGNTGEGELGINESMRLLLTGASRVLASLDVRFRHPVEFRFSESSDEIAFEIVGTLSDQTQTTGILTFRGDNSAIWDWAGNSQVVNIVSSLTDGLHVGWYSIATPFGDRTLSEVRLAAPASFPKQFLYTLNANYSLVGAELSSIDNSTNSHTEAVPEPSAIAGLMLAAGGVIASRQRKAARA
jgi:hypothetical protein